MFTREDLDSWNELFPDCKMREADLANPSETFLVKTLSSYLGMLGYRIDPPLSLNATDGSREKRLFLIKLAQHIEHILKITDKSYTFTYYDLLKPTPKKTSHMLGILLNYLYYYNMYRTDVFSMANDRLKSRQELLDNIGCAQEENEQRKIKSEKMKEELASLSTQLPSSKAEVEALHTQKMQLTEQLMKLKESTTELNTKAHELLARIRTLKRQVVPENEGQELQSQISKLEENLKEREQAKSNMENNLKTHVTDLGELQDLLKNIDVAREIVTPSLLESHKQMVDKLNEANAQAETLRIEKENIVETVRQQEQLLKAFNENYLSTQKQYEDEKQKKLQLIAYKEKSCGALEQQIITLQKEEHALDCLFEEQKDIHEYVENNATTLMKPYTRD